jgi:pyruvate kinase
MRLTRIIATLGPASSEPRVLTALLRAGVDVARLNMSHGTHASHARVIRNLRAVAGEAGRRVGLLVDLQGRKVRIGRLVDGGPLRLRAGERVTLTPRAIVGRAGLLPTTCPTLALDVRPGDPILLDDGRMELRAERRRGRDVQCRVVSGGLLGEHKGMNLPETALRGASLSRRDRHDLDFAIRQGADYLAVSFVRDAADIVRVRRLLQRRGSDIPIIAKLELRLAVEHLQEILAVADGVMIARGDLGVEVALEKVPVLQREILREANRAGVLVVTATEMLESMIERPRPTRAEASDVANAIFDGTDAVMLSAETASGHYPARTVAVMDRIAREAEQSGLRTEAAVELAPGPDRATHAILHAASDAARQAGAKAIVVYTQRGDTARLLSKLKPDCPIIALAPSERVCGRMTMFRGVRSLRVPLASSTERMLAYGDRAMLQRRLIRPGQQLVVVFGTSRRKGATNLMKLHRAGERP